MGPLTLAIGTTPKYNKSMYKKIIIFLLFFATGVLSYAQKIPAKFIRPGFTLGTGLVDMAAVQARVFAPAQRPITPFKIDAVKSVFRAFPQGKTDGHAMSGFIFKTTYQGQEEIFGVIAQHAMPAWNNHSKIGPSFTARVMQGNEVVDIPAQVVQLSAPVMTDIALVKFRPEDEKLLTPLTLAKREPALNEPLSLIGFGTEKLTLITDSPLSEKSMLNLRYPMAGDPEKWPGLCGSPVLNAEGEVVGTVTGSTRLASDPTYYTGYATRNLYLQTLVNAYHGDIEKATYPLEINGEKIVDLHTDEFVSQVILRDENRKIIFRKNIYNKFPYSTIMGHWPKTRYIEMYIDNVLWSGYSLIEGASFAEERYVVYDVQEKQLITDRPRKTY